MPIQYIQNIRGIILENIDVAILIIALLYLAAFVFFVAVSVKLTKIMKKYNLLMRGMDGKNLEEILIKIAEEVTRAKNEIAGMDEKVEMFEKRVKLAIQKVHAIRFNAFDSMGSDLSFSVALLNGENDGFIITSIYGRDENRVYLKPVYGGASSYPLSEEEKMVLERALSEA
ncbi:MAG: DUF4446 family protein [Thermovenabulum sp.]|uniref:DUF4446 family protein n=1 Tax=Thermovenabulum sp. TaxID=3100335 RepID=UPI003C7DF5CF